VARITSWGITNFQVTLEPVVASVTNSQVSEAPAHTGKVQLIASQARPT
jgi:hypothetical protein